MSEVRLTSSANATPITATAGIAPAAPAQSPPAVAPPPPQDAPAVSLGGTLATLNDGDRLEGVVIGEDASGLPILRTANGSYLLSSAQPIAQNTYLVLQIVENGSPIRAVILMENGVEQQPPPEVELSLISADMQGLLEAAALSDIAAVPTEATLERRLVGTVLPDPLAGRPGHARPLPAGSTLVLQLVDVPEKAPKSTLAPTEQFASASTGVAGTATPEKNGDSGNPNPAAEPSLIDAISTPINLLTQAAPQPQPIGTITNATLAGSHIPALVITASTAGQVLVRTPLGLLSVETETSLMAGANLTLEVVSVKLPTKQTAPGTNTFGDPLSRLSHEWPALRKALSALQEVDSAAATLIVGSAVPALNDKLMSGLLFFFAALRGGTIAGWLGKSTLDKLEQASRRELLPRLQEDFADLSRLSRQNPHGDWRAIPVPLNDGHRIVQVMLFVRNHQRQGEAGEDRDLGTRFILNIEFTVTGPIQLDGLVQPNQFDLIVRSHTTLPIDIRQGVSDVFNDCLNVARRRGVLTFQVSQRFPPMPTQQLRVGHSSTAIVV